MLWLASKVDLPFEDHSFENDFGIMDRKSTSVRSRLQESRQQRKYKYFEGTARELHLSTTSSTFSRPQSSDRTICPPFTYVMKPSILHRDHPLPSWGSAPKIKGQSDDWANPQTRPVRQHARFQTIWKADMSMT